MRLDGEIANRVEATLDRLYADFNHADSATDPIQIVRRFTRADDREVVGFCAAALAFGRVASVLQSIERLLAVMGPAPAAYVRRSIRGATAAAFAGLVHRWIASADLVALLWVAAADDRSRRDRSKGFFSRADDPAADDIDGRARQLFDARAWRWTSRPRTARVPKRPASVISFRGRRRERLQAAESVSAVDGAARRARPRRLDARVAVARSIVPLDTHVIRVGRCLRLTRYTSPGWQMARDITASLRRLDPRDPVRYDFSLCHLGMMNACGFSRPQGDAQCPLRGVCRPRVA